MLFNPSRPRTRAKRLSSTNLILIGGEILRGLSFCLVVVLLASAIALTGTSSGIGASSNHLSPAASLHRIAPTTVYPFLPNFKVTDGSSPYKYQVEPTMVINRSGTVFAGWKETDGPDAAGSRAGPSPSTDHGPTWAPIINPGNHGSVLGAIVDTFGNNTVYLTWWDFSRSDILFESSTDGGSTWSPVLRVNDRAGSASGGFPQYPLPAMNVDKQTGAIYVSWADSRNGNPDIYFANSTDGGKTWGTNHRINDNTDSSQQYMVDLAVDGTGKVHAAWEDRRNGNWNIFYSNSTDGGQTWNTNVRVSSEDTPGTLDRPGDYFALEAGPNDYVYVVWTDGRGPDYDIYYARNPGFPVATVTATTSPVGLPVTVDGVTSPSPVQFNWTIGSSHSLGVAATIPAGSGTRYAWDSWSDGGAITHTIVATADETFTASFVKQFQATVGQDPAGLSVLVDDVS